MPTPLIVIGAVLLGIAALLLLRVRILLTCTDTDVKLTLRVLCFSVRLYPKKPPDPKKFSPEAAYKKAQKAAKKAQHKAKKKQKKAGKKELARQAVKSDKRPQRSLREKLLLVKVLLAALLRATGKHLHLRAARLHIIVATGDAATTAVAYGAVSGVLAGIIALLEKGVRLCAEPPQTAVIADFLGDRPHVDIRLHFSMRVGGALLTLFSLAFAFLFGEHRKRPNAADTPARAAQT